MKKKIVIALGGNALGNTLKEQMTAIKTTAKAIVDLIEDGNEVVISHGNGPQVGMINIAMSELHKLDSKYSICPMSVCVAMSQGYIGYDLQNQIKEELLNRNINKNVSTIITQVEVDSKDEAFKNPTKPIGSFMTKEEADIAIKNGDNVIEDSGRGYRRIVASPKPVSIVEIGTIKSLIRDGQVVIACGGGGIPVIKEGNHLKGVGAVIDKDFASCTLAKELDADCLIILTAVEKVAINFGKENEQWLADVNVTDMKKYLEEGHFAPGSMKPKVEAGIEFASSKEGRYSLITLLEKAKDGITGKTGTRIKY
ncbi:MULTISPECIES: carbamate kinase [Clostridium]|uniref:Carbamate kinase n=1 Tax=Clostridium botulinum (strain Eklund 17B / Type B) TaxID=935198 RepID=B2TKM4_CLOBB|nr:MULTISPECIES: carbamate kinase [Clostridium]ACD23920.1 carbamate kinase [Clostridium botulinum B str. Eklund 17B (NRP)]MBN1037608.1 carbamate kinase [Clostridium botulinum]MBN1044290.1 carbamate kinase [Clostridium botulinum]MBN1050959.1 carbamate kinase [Clostridium botulinum]MBN1054255.1 carbamate kinase [Clostridium botulinum]